MRRMPQMESIAESSGSQPSLREEDLLQVGALCKINEYGLICLVD